LHSRLCSFHNLSTTKPRAGTIIDLDVFQRERDLFRAVTNFDNFVGFICLGFSIACFPLDFFLKQFPIGFRLPKHQRSGCFIDFVNEDQTR